MATKNKVNISSDIVAEIKSGNSDTTAAGLRTVLYEILDSYVNVKDGGLVYETEVGYNGLLTLTDQKSFVYKKWVEDYVDNLITGLNWKKSVLYSTNSGEDLSLTGLTAAIDGSLRFLSPTDRILVKNQSTQSLNGIYNPSSGAWTRVVDADSDSEILAATVYVREGSVEKDRVYAVNVSPITLGTTAITFALISGAGAYTYGSYLKLTGNVFDIDFTTFSTNQISDYANKRYQTDNQRLFNDATSSIQTQLDSKVNTLDRKGADYFLKIGGTTFDVRYSTNATAFTSTTNAIGKDAMVAFPFIIEETMTFDRIGAEITTAVASGVCSLLIYDSVNNVPTNLVLDAGTISVASATYQEITINKQITAGLYYLVLWHNGSGAPSFRAMPIAACNKVLGISSTLGGISSYTRIYNSKVYTSAPLIYDTTGITVYSSNNPIISLRRSA